MAIELDRVTLDELPELLTVLGAWQVTVAPHQLHPGDLGWNWRFGAEWLAAAVRVWRRDDEVVAVGLLDEPTLLRLAIAPSDQADEELARRLCDTLDAPGLVLAGGEVAVEAPRGSRVRELLAAAGWQEGDPWTPLHLDLSEPVEPPTVRISAIGPDQVSERCAVQRAAFESSTFTDDRWLAMAAGPAYADARCLVAYDQDDVAVAAATVWSAGPGRAGLLEPLGVHRDHRGHGYGIAITRGAAATLRELGSASAVVCTPSSNAGAVATYAAAGFERLPEVHDLTRGA